MNSSKCPKCLLVQWSESTCKRCGASLDTSSSGYVAPSERTFEPIPARHYTTHAPRPQQLKSGLAIASMVIAIVSLPMMILLIGLLLAPVALVLGIVALVKANRHPAIYGGKGFAVAGISIAAVIFMFFIPITAAIAIPNLLAARRAANEGSAYTTLKKLAAAQENYSSTNDSGDCGDTMVLASKNLIAGDLAGGLKNGYRFEAGGNLSEANGCEVRATPESRSQGGRSFYFSSVDGVFRVTTRESPAGRNDAPLAKVSSAD